MKLSVFPNSQMPQTAKLRNAKPDNYLDTCVAVTYFFPLGFIHSNSVTYSQSKKTEVAYFAAVSYFLLGQKR